jgi:methyl-accepting chemotaxis protein
MKTRRRILKIKSKFQNQLILETTLVSFIFTNCLILLMFLFSEGGHDASLLKLKLAVILAAGQVVGLVLVYRYSLKASHRIAGPLWNLERQLTRLGNGDLTVHVRLREHDHLQDTAALFNETVLKLRKNISAVKTTVEALRNEHEVTNRAADLVATLSRHLDSLQTEIHDTEAATTETSSVKTESPVPIHQEMGNAAV